MMENPDFCLRKVLCLNYYETGNAACRGCLSNMVYLNMYQLKIQQDPDQQVSWECPMCEIMQRTKINQGKVLCPTCQSEVWVSLPDEYNICTAYKG
jgi:hypothetical protein